MKYAIVGLGAVGSIIARYLMEAQEHVVLLGKNDHVESIKKQGLIIDGKQYLNDTLNITNDFAMVSGVDVVFVCVKSQDTEPVAHLMQKHLKKNTLIISLQNGVHNAQVLRDITKVKAISGVVLFNAVSSSPGVASLTMKGGLVLEFSNEHASALSEIKNLFKSQGLDVRFVFDIEPVLWSKLIVNTQIAVTALTGQTIRESMKNRDSRIIIIATLREALFIVKQVKIPLRSLPGIDPKRIIRILRFLGPFSAVLSKIVLGMKDDARNSMWQSLSQGKTTEIDYINGEIVHLADQKYLKAPVNTKLVELVKKTETRIFEKPFQPHDLRKILKL